LGTPRLCLGFVGVMNESEDECQWTRRKYDRRDRRLNATLNQRLKEALYCITVYQDHNTPLW
jgi:hypothetical protein